MADTGSSTFVLVHGAWHGGWCWAQVADILKGQGHTTTTPTQTGLGERAHLLSPEISLETFRRDIVNHIVCEDLTDVVLVGHSFGGCAIIGAADEIPDRIRQLIFLDSMIVENGRSPFSYLDPQVRAEREALAQKTSGGVSIPPPGASAFGVTIPEQAAWLERCLTPHPLNTFVTSLDLRHDVGNGLPLTYIICEDPIYEPLAGVRERVRNYGWPTAGLQTGHNAMITAPQETADLFMTLAADFKGSSN